MPYRQIQFENHHFYHIYTRSVDDLLTFSNPINCQRFIDLMTYYAVDKPPTRFSYFKRWIQGATPEELSHYSKNITYIIKIHSYCLMPNHIHLLVSQLKDNGIHDFFRRTLNAYSRFFNLKYHRKGPLFESNFQAVLIDSDQYLIHLVRYIHLNPVTAYIVEDPTNYQFSSYNLYLNPSKTPSPFETKTILQYFKNIDDFKQFHLEYKHEQRLTAKIRKELLIDL